MGQAFSALGRLDHAASSELAASPHLEVLKDGLHGWSVADVSAVCGRLRQRGLPDGTVCWTEFLLNFEAQRQVRVSLLVAVSGECVYYV